MDGGFALGLGLAIAGLLGPLLLLLGIWGETSRETASVLAGSDLLSSTDRPPSTAERKFAEP